MRKINVSTFVTLDGVLESPHKWPGSFWSDEMNQYARDQLFASDALLMGRVTYEGFAAAWPSRTDNDGFADRMNSLPKFVVSTTLDKADWSNSTLIKANVADEVARLKQQPGQDILMYGSARLMHTLMRHNLIDDYRLWVYPLVLGKGQRLFPDGFDTTALKLADTTRFSSGVVVLEYQPTS